MCPNIPTMYSRSNTCRLVGDVSDGGTSLTYSVHLHAEENRSIITIGQRILRRGIPRLNTSTWKECMNDLLRHLVAHQIMQRQLLEQYPEEIAALYGEALPGWYAEETAETWRLVGEGIALIEMVKVEEGVAAKYAPRPSRERVLLWLEGLPEEIVPPVG